MSWVYGMLAKAEAGKVYIKFGWTDDVDKRLRLIQTGCPLEIVRVFRVQAGGNAQLIELYLHSFFGHRLSFGEWFLFDLTDPKQKDEFSRGCFQAFTVYMDEKWEWIETEVDPALRRKRDQRRARLIVAAKSLRPLAAKGMRDPNRNFWMNGVM